MTKKKSRQKGGKKARRAVQDCPLKPPKAQLIVNIVEKATNRPIPSDGDIVVNATALGTAGTKISQAIYWDVPYGKYRVTLQSLPASVQDAGYYLPEQADQQVAADANVDSELEVVTLKLPFTWVAIKIVDDAGHHIDGTSVKIKLPGDKIDEKPCPESGARFEKFRKDDSSIEEINSTETVWEFVSIESV